ncbi:ONEC2 protein, partial [Origma solitaria]|nr:ONEC2 protein [Origma solitaria]
RPAMVPSMASLLDGAAEYRPELSIPLHHAMSVPCEASPPGMGMSGTYTTLTPLQPLPPISAEGPAVGQSLSPLGNGLGPLPGAQQGLHGYGPPSHDKMLSPNFEAHAAMLARGEQHLAFWLRAAAPGAHPSLSSLVLFTKPCPGCCCHPAAAGALPSLPISHRWEMRSFLQEPARLCRASALTAGTPLIRAAPWSCLQSGDEALQCPCWGWLAGSVGTTLTLSLCLCRPFPACKRKEQEPNKERNNSQKKSRLVFTDLQRRTLFAIFKENKRPSKEMQMTISQQLGLELNTVSNFFMNARRRSLEKWQDDLSSGGSSSAPSTCTKA